MSSPATNLRPLPTCFDQPTLRLDSASTSCSKQKKLAEPALSSAAAVSSAARLSFAMSPFAPIPSASVHREPVRSSSHFYEGLAAAYESHDTRDGMELALPPIVDTDVLVRSAAFAVGTGPAARCNLEDLFERESMPFSATAAETGCSSAVAETRVSLSPYRPSEKAVSRGLFKRIELVAPVTSAPSSSFASIVRSESRGATGLTLVVGHESPRPRTSPLASPACVSPSKFRLSPTKAAAYGFPRPGSRGTGELARVIKRWRDPASSGQYDITPVNHPLLQEQFWLSQYPPTPENYWSHIIDKNIQIAVQFEKSHGPASDYHLRGRAHNHRFGGYTVSLLSRKTLHSDLLTQRVYLITAPSGESRHVNHFFLHWVDFKLPNLEAFAILMKHYQIVIDQLARTAEPSPLEVASAMAFAGAGDGSVSMSSSVSAATASCPPEKPRTLVHCTAGRGRSGCFPLFRVVLGMKEISYNATEAVMASLRDQRPGLVKLATQRAFITQCAFAYRNRSSLAAAQEALGPCKLENYEPPAKKASPSSKFASSDRRMGDRRMGRLAETETDPEGLTSYKMPSWPTDELAVAEKVAPWKSAKAVEKQKASTRPEGAGAMAPDITGAMAPSIAAGAAAAKASAGVGAVVAARPPLGSFPVAAAAPMSSSLPGSWDALTSAVQLDPLRGGLLGVLPGSSAAGSLLPATAHVPQHPSVPARAAVPQEQAPLYFRAYRVVCEILTGLIS